MIWQSCTRAKECWKRHLQCWKKVLKSSGISKAMTRCTVILGLAWELGCDKLRVREIERGTNTTERKFWNEAQFLWRWLDTSWYWCFYFEFCRCASWPKEFYFWCHMTILCWWYKTRNERNHLFFLLYQQFLTPLHYRTRPSFRRLCPVMNILQSSLTTNFWQPLSPPLTSIALVFWKARGESTE